MNTFDTVLSGTDLIYHSLDEPDIYKAIRTAADLAISFYERQMGPSWQFQNSKYPATNVAANVSECIALGYTASGKVVGIEKDSRLVVELANSNLLYRDSDGYACTIRYEKYYIMMPDGELEKAIPEYNEACRKSGHDEWQILIFADLYCQC